MPSGLMLWSWHVETRSELAWQVNCGPPPKRISWRGPPVSSDRKQTEKNSLRRVLLTRLSMQQHKAVESSMHRNNKHQKTTYESMLRIQRGFVCPKSDMHHYRVEIRIVTEPVASVPRWRIKSESSVPLIILCYVVYVFSEIMVFFWYIEDIEVSNYWLFIYLVYLYVQHHLYIIYICTVALHPSKCPFQVCNSYGCVQGAWGPDVLEHHRSGPPGRRRQVLGPETSSNLGSTGDENAGKNYSILTKNKCLEN